MPVILLRIPVQTQPGQIVGEILSQKYPTQKRAAGVAQAAECLPSKQRASTTLPHTKRPFRNCLQNLKHPTPVS
jgi:hypothetical protein